MEGKTLFSLYIYIYIYIRNNSRTALCTSAHTIYHSMRKGHQKVAGVTAQVRHRRGREIIERENNNKKRGEEMITKIEK